jgi:phosphoserine aminotransferase
MSRVIYNFSPGPSALPKEVLRQAASELENWHQTGVSVMEMSHRSVDFMSIYHEAQELFKELLNIPDTYALLFLQGGAIGENAIVPLNLLKTGADYVVSGAWSLKSFNEAVRYGDVKLAGSSQAEQFMTVPDPVRWQIRSSSDYVHVCTNETVQGTEFIVTPEILNVVGKVPVVADMSSHLLSRSLNVADYGVIYGGAQKNVGIAGLTFVIVRKDLLGKANPLCPNAFNWTVASENDSMFNTPPTFAIYMAGLVLKWIKAKGGVKAIEQENIKKANLLYGCIDTLSDMYECRVDSQYRSRMNVCFFLKDESLYPAFLEGAKAQGLLNLKGHKMVGGIRASIYNAMPLEGVERLCEYLTMFKKEISK